MSYLDPLENLVKEKEGQLFAADIFSPTEFAQKCRIAAAVFAVLAAVLSFFLPELILPILKQHVTRLGVLPVNIANLSPLQLLATRTAFAVLTLFTFYPLAAKGIFSATLRLKLAEKKENIDRNLYTALCMLAGFGKGGLPIIKALELLANSKLEGIRQEFSKIYIFVKVGKYTLAESMLQVALTTPSVRLSHFLKGFVSFIERSKNYGRYVDEFLQLDNVNRRIELTAYGEKLKQLSSLYVTLITILASSSIIALMMSIAQSGFDYTPIIVYIALPAASFVMALMYYIGSPDKGADRLKKKEAAQMAIFMVALGLIAGFVPVLKVKTFILAGATAMAAILHAYFRRAAKADEMVEHELNTLLMSLYASVQSGESILPALKNIGGELGNRLRRIVALSKAFPLGDVMSEEAENVKHPFLATVLYVLGNVIHSTRRFGEVLTALIYEYHRYIEYMKLRRSIITMTTAVVLMGFVVTAFCMGIVKLQMVPMLARVAARAQTAVININPKQAAEIANDTVIMLAATTPFTLSSISWDFRYSFKYFAVLYAIALAFVMLS